MGTLSQRLVLGLSILSYFPENVLLSNHMVKVPPPKIEENKQTKLN